MKPVLKFNYAKAMQEKTALQIAEEIQVFISERLRSDPSATASNARALLEIKVTAQ